MSFYLILVVCLLQIPNVRHYFNLHLGSSPIAQDQNYITILSYNAMMGKKLMNKQWLVTEEVKDQLQEILEQSPQPDIICLQEVNTLVKDFFNERMHYPFVHSIEKRGTMILSKYPIINAGEVDIDSRLNSCLWADIDIKNTSIRVYTAHLESNRIESSSHHLLTEEKQTDLKAVKGLIDLFGKYNRYTAKRADQALKIRDHMDKSPVPILFCGDLNEPALSYIYKVIRKDFSDAYITSGKGIGTTWKSFVPFIRIDYILSSRDLKSKRYYILDSDLSDHYPVKALFSI